MDAFSFVHTSDLHLGYSQYGLEARRQDFDDVFAEIVEKAIELKPDFMIIAGDLFHQSRPSNITLENSIRSFKRLRDAGISVLTVDGSHDSAPNMITGTILYPLDSAGLVFHLPRHQGACWRKPNCCYVYGIPNFRTRHKTEEALPAFMAANPPATDSAISNIFVFHMAIDIPSVNPPYIEAEAPPEIIPDGFDYYAGGHIHKHFLDKFKTGVLAYSGSTETVSYNEAEQQKGFLHVKVNHRGEFSPEFIELSSPRKFNIIDQDFSGMTTSKITELAVQLVKNADEEEAVVIPVLRGVLPPEANRGEVDINRIRRAAEKALIVHPIIQLKEKAISDEIVHSIFEGELEDLKTKSFEYFLRIFSHRYGREKAERIARLALDLIEPLKKKREEKVKQILEELKG